MTQYCLSGVMEMPVHPNVTIKARTGSVREQREELEFGDMKETTFIFFQSITTSE